MIPKINSTCFVMISLFCIITAGTSFAGDIIESNGPIEPNKIVNVATPAGGVIGQVHVTKSVPVKIEGESKVQEGRFSYARCKHKQVGKLLSSEAIVAAKHDKATTGTSLALAHF
jgi:hypothetical protein